MKMMKYSADSRGVGEAGWLHSRFSFSFANYWNPARMGFGALRVLNDDIIEGGGGFPMHPHSDMEIITLVTGGTLEHTDSEGNGGVLGVDGVQVMSAGSGILHSEFNHSATEPLSLFQLWIETKEEGITPRYDQKSFSFPQNALTTIASGLADPGALIIHQDARVIVGSFGEGGVGSVDIGLGRGVFVLVIEGSFTIGNETLLRRDAIEVSETGVLTISAVTPGRIMCIEVPLN